MDLAQCRRILVIGGCGMIGIKLVPLLRVKYGRDRVIVGDIRKQRECNDADTFVHCDVTNFNQLESVIVEHNIDAILNLAAILSAASEANPQLAMRVNMRGFENILEVARIHNVNLVFSPSSITAFGPSTPKASAPDVTVMRPTYLYGICKVHNELLIDYYHHKYGLDIRCLRYPCLISCGGEARGRINDFVVDIFQSASDTKRYICDLTADSLLPFLYVDDCVNGTVKFLETPRKKLSQSVYNVTAFSMTPAQLAKEIQKHIPSFEISYAPDVVKMAIVNSLPHALDDSKAHEDWGWQAQYSLEDIVQMMMSKFCVRS